MPRLDAHNNRPPRTQLGDPVENRPPKPSRTVSTRVQKSWHFDPILGDLALRDSVF
jgi:hypothetical protein